MGEEIVLIINYGVATRKNYSLFDEFYSQTSYGLLLLYESLRTKGKWDVRFIEAASCMYTDGEIVNMIEGMELENKKVLVLINYFFNTRQKVNELLKKIKKEKANIKTVGGGHDITFGIDSFPEKYDVDIVCKFEAEHIIDTLVEDIFNNFNNIENLEGKENLYRVEKINNKVVIIPEEPIGNVEGREWKVKHLPKHDHYIGFTTSIATSKGCPFNCRFCTSPAFYSRKKYLRKVEEIKEEMNYAFLNGKRYIAISDDDFLLGRSKNEIEQILQYAREIGMKLWFMSRLELVKFYWKIIEQFSDVIQRILIGVENINEKENEVYDKTKNIDDWAKDFVEIKHQLESKNIGVIIGYIIVNQNTTLHSYENSVEFLKRTGDIKFLLYLVHRLRLYPGSDVFKEEKGKRGNINTLTYDIKDKKVEKLVSLIEPLLFEVTDDNLTNPDSLNSDAVIFNNELDNVIYDIEFKFIYLKRLLEENKVCNMEELNKINEEIKEKIKNIAHINYNFINKMIKNVENDNLKVAKQEIESFLQNKKRQNLYYDLTKIRNKLNRMILKCQKERLKWIVTRINSEKKEYINFETWIMDTFSIKSPFYVEKIREIMKEENMLMHDEKFLIKTTEEFKRIVFNNIMPSELKNQIVGLFFQYVRGDYVQYPKGVYPFDKVNENFILEKANSEKEDLSFGKTAKAKSLIAKEEIVISFDEKYNPQGPTEVQKEEERVFNGRPISYFAVPIFWEDYLIANIFFVTTAEIDNYVAYCFFETVFYKVRQIYSFIANFVKILYAFSFYNEVKKEDNYALYLLKREKDSLFISSLQNAISQIIIRNLSHNIGSHVLADLILTDAKGVAKNHMLSLLRYIQNRMDFVARVSETLRVPSSSGIDFVNQLMKGFYDNFLLIDRVAVSEGLRGYTWGKWIDNETRGKIIVRIKKGDDWIIDEFKNEPYISGDVKLAVPVDIVGHHAFYSILENILRNTAKHDYRRYKDKIKMGEKLDVDNIKILWVEEVKDNLVGKEIYKNDDGLMVREDVNISIQDAGGYVILIPYLEYEKITLKDSIPDYRYWFVGIEQEDNIKNMINNDKSPHLLSPKEWGIIKEKVNGIVNGKENGSKIDLFNDLVKYLNRMPLRLNIKIDENKDDDYVWITVWTDMPQKMGEDKKLFDEINEKLKRVFVDRNTGRTIPKDWGISEIKICSAFLQQRFIEELGMEGEDIIKERDSNGVIKRDEEYQKRLGISDPMDTNYPRMIIRALPVDREGNEITDINNHDVYYLAYRFWMKKPKVAAIYMPKSGDNGSENESGNEYEDGNYIVITQSDNDWEIAKINEQKLRNKGIYVLERLIFNIDHDFLILNKEGYKELKGEIIKNGSIDYTILESLPARIVVFGKKDGDDDNEVLSKRVAFVEEGNKKKDDEIIKTAYKAWIKLIMGEEGKNIIIDKNLIWMDLRGNDKPSDDKEIKREDIIEFMDKVFTNNNTSWRHDFNNNADELIDFIEKGSSFNNTKTFWEMFLKVMGRNNSLFYKNPDILKEILSGFRVLIKKIITQYKYFSGENAYMPAVYEKNEDGSSGKNFGNNNNAIIYINRHNLEKNGEQKGIFYSENISGGSWHYYLYDEWLKNKENDLLTYRIIEMAITNIYVVDERVKRFYDRDEKIREKFCYANIYVYDSIDELENDRNRRNCTKNKGLNILIVHQTILDNYSGDINELRDKYPLIYTTTGRGGMVKVNEDLRLIPFSIVEDYLLKENFSKINLVNALMNALRVGKR